jgi:hypothetical protein
MLFQSQMFHKFEVLLHEKTRFHQIFYLVSWFLLGGCPRMAIFSNLCVMLKFWHFSEALALSSKYFNVFLWL